MKAFLWVIFLLVSINAFGIISANAAPLCFMPLRSYENYGSDADNRAYCNGSCKRSCDAERRDVSSYPTTYELSGKLGCQGCCCK